MSKLAGHVYRHLQAGITTRGTQPTAAASFHDSQHEGMLGRSPEAVAEFLAKTEGLNKTLIGEQRSLVDTSAQAAS